MFRSYIIFFLAFVVGSTFSSVTVAQVANVTQQAETANQNSNQTIPADVDRSALEELRQRTESDNQLPFETRVIDRKTSEVFGDFIFGGQFANQSFVGFNPSYEISVGDVITLQLWGGFDFIGVVPVDAQGNIFIPKVGPVKVQGVQNKDLNFVVTEAIKQTYRRNVGVYASLDGAEPVKVFVTGFVRQPGLYAGHASDSVLYFLDRAGGIDPDRGSFRKVRLLRNGRTHQEISLYDFILSGQLPFFQINDGDTIVVDPVGSRAKVSGQVQNPALFEFSDNEIGLQELLTLAQPTPQATHARISRNNLRETRVDYVALSVAETITVAAGDVVEVTSDKNPGTISVRVVGEHLSEKEFVLPYGARLGDVLRDINFGEDAQVDSIQLMRQSVRSRQKEMLEAQLQALESSVLTARSNTQQEAALRTSEAQLILQWVERARQIQPKGQVALADLHERDNVLLEAGDVIRVPRKSNLIMVHGDVLFPSTMTYGERNTVQDYIEMAGGFTQSNSASNVLLLHQDGTFQKLSRGDVDDRDVMIRPGDEIFVLPKVQVKSFQLAQDVINVIFQLALAAGVVVGI